MKSVKVTVLINEKLGEGIPGAPPQIFFDNYKNCFFISNQNRSIIITQEKVMKLRSIDISNQAMNDDRKTWELLYLQPVDEETLFIFQVLIIYPELAQQFLGYTLNKGWAGYVVHVKKNDSSLHTVFFHWNTDEWKGPRGWFCRSQPSKEYRDWVHGETLLYLSTT